MKYLKTYEDITKENLPKVKEDYFLVHLNGNISYNIEGIVKSINSKKIFEYPYIQDYLTLLNPKYYKNSLLYHSLLNMISGSKEINGWFNGEWIEQREWGNLEQRVDTLYYDEFCFLAAEDLIKFDDYECLTLEDIWTRNGININKKKNDLLSEHPELKSLFDAKDYLQLRSAYRKLVKQWHPDKVGENDIIRYVTDLFFKFKKKFNK